MVVPLLRDWMVKAMALSMGVAATWKTAVASKGLLLRRQLATADTVPADGIWVIGGQNARCTCQSPERRRIRLRLRGWIRVGHVDHLCFW